ncbi:hemolysin XhlA family protein [uncultured Clostridium sp.]|uniref:hemolysin XhlA family protein n=1 Tax=uncultured Clostridium sp. TaxID=59620 RepID=UPI0028E542E3|nr:hemolysin XhlA family protein [uncultured Clostridium sp.]
MNDELVKDKLATHDRRLNNHGDRLDKLEQDNASFRTELKNLCDNLKQLTGVLKWLIALGISTLVGFFIYTIQTGIFNK